MNNLYEKFNPNENINIGDVIIYLPIAKKVTRASFRYDHAKLIGICCNIQDDLIEVQTEGIVDVNVQGNICIGDQLTISKTEGIARAIPYVNQDTVIFKQTRIGKVIGLYNIYNKVQVLLNIKEGDRYGAIK